MKQPQQAETISLALDAPALRDLAARLTELLRLRTLPIGMKLFEDAAAMDAVPGLRRPTAAQHFTTCQLVTQSRIGGLTLGIVGENVMPGGNCGAVPGIAPLSHEHGSGERMDGVWFQNREAAAAHQRSMPRVAAGRYQGLAVSPLRTARLSPPDIVLFYATPGQMILFINGLQWRSYRRYGFEVTGESACADSWGRALATREVCLSIPCYAERRYGGVADDEMLMALPPAELARAVEGLEGLSRAGLRYPILPFGVNADPMAGMARSYSKLKN